MKKNNDNAKVSLKGLKKSTSTPTKTLLGDKRYKFVDNGASVLGVCHLDTVQPLSDKLDFVNHKDGLRIYNPVWDDRLGLYTLVYHLPNYHGIKLDWLFTTDEEKGASTANDFMQDYLDGKVTDKTWNWIVEFDRMATDVAVYGYYETSFNNLLGSYFDGRVTHGSFTDITDMEELNVKGFNVGVGYYDNHSARAYMVVEEYLNNIDGFVRFHNENAAIRLDHTPYNYKRYSTNLYDYSAGGQPYDNAKWGYYDIYGTNRKDNVKRVKNASQCDICDGYGAQPITTTLDGREIYMCQDCLQDSVERFYRNQKYFNRWG